MSKEKRDLLNNIKALGYTVLQISKETDIPSGRMYKWFDGDGLPKLEDTQTLTFWYNSKKEESNKTEEPTVGYQSVGNINVVDLLQDKITLLEQLLQKSVDENEYLKYIIKQNGIKLGSVNMDGSLKSKAS